MKNRILILLLLMIFSACAKLSKEQKFWNWFEKNNEKFLENVDNIELRESLFEELTIELHKINKELTFEFSPINENGIRELTISADGLKEVFPYVIKLVETAPEIPNWKINAFRQRVPGNDLEISFGDFSIKYSDIYFKYAEDGDKIGLVLYVRNFDNSGRSKNIIYILLDSLIGEYDVETLISWIEWEKLDESDIETLIPLVELRDLIDKTKKNVAQQGVQLTWVDGWLLGTFSPAGSFSSGDENAAPRSHASLTPSRYASCYGDSADKDCLQEITFKIKASDDNRKRIHKGEFKMVV